MADTSLPPWLQSFGDTVGLPGLAATGYSGAKLLGRLGSYGMGAARGIAARPFPAAAALSYGMGDGQGNFSTALNAGEQPLYVRDPSTGQMVPNPNNPLAKPLLAAPLGATPGVPAGREALPAGWSNPPAAPAASPSPSAQQDGAGFSGAPGALMPSASAPGGAVDGAGFMGPPGRLVPWQTPNGLPMNTGQPMNILPAAQRAPGSPADYGGAGQNGPGSSPYYNPDGTLVGNMFGTAKYLANGAPVGQAPQNAVGGIANLIRQFGGLFS